MAALTAGALPIGHGAAGGVEAWLDGAALAEAFTGKTIEGSYASGKPFRETYGADGAIEYREKDLEFHGHWSVQAGSFCTIYTADPSGGCYRVLRVSENCYEFYFVTKTEAGAAAGAVGRPKWTARAAVADRTSTCDDRPAV